MGYQDVIALGWSRTFPGVQRAQQKDAGVLLLLEKRAAEAGEGAGSCALPLLLLSSWSCCMRRSRASSHAGPFQSFPISQICCQALGGFLLAFVSKCFQLRSCWVPARSIPPKHCFPGSQRKKHGDFASSPISLHAMVSAWMHTQVGLLKVCLHSPGAQPLQGDCQGSAIYCCSAQGEI